MLFRRNKPPVTHTPHGTVYGTFPQQPERPRVEYVGLTLAEMEAFERILLHADECTRRARPDIGHSSYTTELIGRLYQSAGAASVMQPDPDLVRIPIQKADFMWLEYSIRDIEMYRGNLQTARDARQLLNRCNALLGQQRAVIHMGGTPMFDPDAPAPVSVDVPELPAH
ncbi:hypothetical protein [Streptomyces candidus]|uniref:Uncharacterized protein n=1 Tax=Streptomyces candidus TaxID=67283 RepID=A0A7X0HL42_9ACTN|nr:hypothetical protein [Streptomyces candidus]MBB6439556.1 hypothetical protein [Streptomyces candidus]GHH54554.1 hypothetical protein GCM10018773_57690 [Streptomyces candidus]